MSFRSLLRGVAGSAAVAAALTLHAPVAFGDSISPTSFSADLGLGETAHVTKTVTISAGGPTSALVDIMFVFDTTGSMGGAIAGAQSTATTVLNSLNTTYGGNLFSGAGFYNDPGAGITQDLTGTIADTQTAINGYFASGGGDYPELGYDGVGGAAANASWRPGSNRFIVALGDAGFKTGAFDEASTQTALTAANVHLIGVDFCASSGTCSLNPTFDSSITGLGGTVFASSTSSDDIAAAIIAGVSSGFANYTHVTVGDLGAGAPMIGLTVTCLTADTGTCVGSDAVGTYDRSVDRTFTFDVAFTRTGPGDTTFDSHALVDGGIVADERDRFAAVPEPATLLLVAGGLLGLGFGSRRRLH